ncbi:MAG: Uma2 family endonuclease [Pirellulaceae bacterium]
MSSAISTVEQAEQRFVFRDLSWSQYESILAALGNRRLRHTYVRGTLEIMSPSRHHAWVRSLLAAMVGVLCRELSLPRLSVGSTSFQDANWDHGFEADEGFYVGRESVVRGREWDRFDADRNSPPDLFIEVDIASSSDQRLDIYRRMRVAEVWRYRHERVRIYVLDESGKFDESDRSRLFPFLTSAALSDVLASRHESDDTQIERDFERWVREHLAGDRLD